MFFNTDEKGNWFLVLIFFYLIPLQLAASVPSPIPLPRPGAKSAAPTKREPQTPITDCDGGTAKWSARNGSSVQLGSGGEGAGEKVKYFSLQIKRRNAHAIECFDLSA